MSKTNVKRLNQLKPEELKGLMDVVEDVRKSLDDIPTGLLNNKAMKILRPLKMTKKFRDIMISSICIASTKEIKEAIKDPNTPGMFKFLCIMYVESLRKGTRNGVLYMKMFDDAIQSIYTRNDLLEDEIGADSGGGTLLLPNPSAWSEKDVKKRQLELNSKVKEIDVEASKA